MFDNELKIKYFNEMILNMETLPVILSSIKGKRARTYDCYVFWYILIFSLISSQKSDKDRK